jgi:hypothetical protein
MMEFKTSRSPAPTTIKAVTRPMMIHITLLLFGCTFRHHPFLLSSDPGEFVRVDYNANHLNLLLLDLNGKP